MKPSVWGPWILAAGAALTVAAEPHGWVEMPLRGVERPTEYTWDRKSGVWRATAHCGASALESG